MGGKRRIVMSEILKELMKGDLYKSLVDSLPDDEKALVLSTISELLVNFEKNVIHKVKKQNDE